VGHVVHAAHVVMTAVQAAPAAIAHAAHAHHASALMANRCHHAAHALTAGHAAHVARALKAKQPAAQAAIVHHVHHVNAKPLAQMPTAMVQTVSHGIQPVAPNAKLSVKRNAALHRPRLLRLRQQLPTLKKRKLVACGPRLSIHHKFRCDISDLRHRRGSTSGPSDCADRAW